MTYEEVKKILEDIIFFKKESDKTYIDFDELKRKNEAINYQIDDDKTPQKNTCVTDKLKEKQIYLEQTIEKQIKNENIVKEAVSKLNGYEQKLIIERYFCGKTYQSLAFRYSYCERQIRRKINKVIYKISKMI